MLYPERDTFHITEVVSFYGIIGLYYLKNSDLKEAKAYFDFLNDLDPDHAFTKRIKRELIIKSLINLRKKLKP